MAEQPILDAVVVGGGQAGLGMAYYLREAGRLFVVFERGRVGESWRSQRWDSFALNTPNWMNGLPGAPYDGPMPDGFWLKDELVASFERYVERFELPVETGVTVRKVMPRADGNVFDVHYANGETTGSVVTRNVIIASGIMQAPMIPALSAELPEWITQLHTADYRNPQAIPEGAVLVVGGGQSGCQIVEDLLDAGRAVYLCTSNVGRIPRRYRGRDILEWWRDMGFLDVRVEDLEDPAIASAAQPQVSGVGRYGRTVSLQALARRGVTLLGRAVEVQGEVLQVDDQLVEHMRFADEKSAKFKQDIDAYVEEQEYDAAPPDDEPADRSDPLLSAADTTLRLNLRAAGINTIIWCTGFTGDFSWIEAPVRGADGQPLHERGVSPTPGLYFLGFPWLASRKSGIIYGIEEDAAFIAGRIAGRLG